TTKESKKVTIITKKIDKNGEEIVEKRVIEGDDVDEVDIDQLIEEAKKSAKEIDVQVEKEEMRATTKRSKNGSKNIWIEKDGETIELDDVEGERIMIFKTKDGELIELNSKELQEEHIIIKKEDNADEAMQVTVTVDEDGNTKIVKRRVRKAQVDYEAKLAEMGIQLPVLGEPVANYVHAVTSNNLVFLAGKGPRTDEGKNIVGKLGKDLTVEQGYEAAKWAGINLLAALKGEVGDLNKVKRIVKVKGMVNAVPDFVDHSKVINGFSDLMVAVFGDKGKHARAAVGMSSLPGNMAVEIEVVVEIE
ncbi:MAG: RidA family protein, partial [Bacteroidota bacterium]